MMNHILQQKGQTATSGMLVFIGRLWYATEHTVERFLSKGVSLFLHMQTPKESVLDKLWAEEVGFECQVSCV